MFHGELVQKPAPAKPISPRSGDTWRVIEPAPVEAAVTMIASALAAQWKPELDSMTPHDFDEYFLRRSFDVARRSTTYGNHPFGAILVDQNRNVLLEAENGYMPDHDGTAHAERLLATQGLHDVPAEVLRAATLYSSAEPCAMCAGAIYWAGIGRLVYGLSEHGCAN